MENPYFAVNDFVQFCKEFFDRHKDGLFSGEELGEQIEILHGDFLRNLIPQDHIDRLSE